MKIADKKLCRLVNFGGEWWIWLASGKRFFKKVDEMVKMVEGSGGYGRC